MPLSSSVARPAADITLTFNYPIDLERSRFEIFNEDDQIVPLSAMEVERRGDDVVLPINTQLPPGSYTLRWNVFSEDGQVERGMYTFTVN